LAPSAGATWFDDKLDFGGEVSFGLRFGMEANHRFSVLMDFAQVDPARKTTGKSARVSSLRALGQCRLLTGSVRPYLMGGFGGVLFHFDDGTTPPAERRERGGGVEYAGWKQASSLPSTSPVLPNASRHLLFDRQRFYRRADDRCAQSVVAGVSVGF
jgi:hypothetical protein